MILWLWRLVWGNPACEHRWELVEEVRVYDTIWLHESAERVMPAGYKYVLRCERCGDIAVRRT